MPARQRGDEGDNRRAEREHHGHGGGHHPALAADRVREQAGQRHVGRRTAAEHRDRGDVISGTADFFVEVAVPDLARYEQLLLDEILTIPSVGNARSTFAIRTVLTRGPLPLDHWR